MCFQNKTGSALGKRHRDAKWECVAALKSRKSKALFADVAHSPEIVATNAEFR